jgi:hypothetical protein
MGSRLRETPTGPMLLGFWGLPTLGNRKSTSRNVQVKLPTAVRLAFGRRTYPDRTSAAYCSHS